jgi:phage/plasmid-like protein (TIGR03299 family)
MTIQLNKTHADRAYGVLASVPTGSDLVGALSAGDLLWSVEGLPISAYRNGDNFALPGYQCVSRITPYDDPIPLGIVSKSYEVIQNIDAFAPLEQLRLDGRLSYAQAGGTKLGARVFVLCDLAEGTTITGEDPHVRRLIATTAHDGSGSLRLIPMLERVYCTNALTMVGKFRKAIISIKHDRLAAGRVLDLNTSLTKSLLSLAEMEREYEALMSTTVHGGDVEVFLAELFPRRGQSATDRMRDTVVRNRNDVRSIYNGQTGTQANLHGTAAGLLNAATEWEQHFHGKSAERRSARLLEGRSDQFMDRAWYLAGAL